MEGGSGVLNDPFAVLVSADFAPLVHGEADRVGAVKAGAVVVSDSLEGFDQGCLGGVGSCQLEALDECVDDMYPRYWPQPGSPLTSG